MGQRCASVDHRLPPQSRAREVEDRERERNRKGARENQSALASTIALVPLPTALTDRFAWTATVVTSGLPEAVKDQRRDS